MYIGGARRESLPTEELVRILAGRLRQPETGDNPPAYHAN